MADASYPDDLLYHPEHDWVRLEDGTAVLGITWYAQDALGEVVFFDPPEVGGTVTAGEAYTEVESVKAVSPDIVGMSGLLSVAFTSMRDTVALIKSHADELARLPVTIVGGGTIDEVAARYIGADYWTTDAMEGVRICQGLMEGVRRPAAGPR